MSAGLWIGGGVLAVFRAGMVLLVAMAGQLSAAREDLEAAEARIAGYEEAARWRAKETQRAAEAAALDETLAKGAGADAPLSDYLRGAAGRVWP